MKLIVWVKIILVSLSGLRSFWWTCSILFQSSEGCLLWKGPWLCCWHWCYHWKGLSNPVQSKLTQSAGHAEWYSKYTFGLALLEVRWERIDTRTTMVFTWFLFYCKVSTCEMSFATSLSPTSLLLQPKLMKLVINWKLCIFEITKLRYDSKFYFIGRPKLISAKVILKILPHFDLVYLLVFLNLKKNFDLLSNSSVMILSAGPAVRPCT